MKPETLQLFCSTDPLRKKLRKPFTLGVFTYATDGRVLIRVPKIVGFSEDIELGMHPDNIITNPNAYKPVVYPRNWQDFQPARVSCPWCKGTGNLSECPTCKGTGEVECCECGRDDECHDCDGSGKIYKENKPATIECEECDGQGTYEKACMLALNWGEVFVNLEYIRRIHILPDVRLFYLNETSPLRFEFSGGDGILMPLNKDHQSQQIIADQWPTSTTTPHHP